MSGLELHEAASTGDFEFIEELLRTGKINVNLRDDDWQNRTALHWACAKGHVECIRRLLDHGAYGTARTDSGWTPAHFAAEAGRITVLRALYAANVSVFRKDKYGDTPRRIAAMYALNDCVKYLQIVQRERNNKRIKAGLPEDSDDSEDHV